jgi:hypothetical protein
MFKRVGSKVKTFAKVLFVLQVVFACLVGLALIVGGIIGGSMAYGEYSVLIIIGGIVGGIFYIGLGILFAWLSVLVMYAVGEAADKAEAAANDTAVLRGNLDVLQRQLSAMQGAPVAEPQYNAYPGPAPMGDPGYNGYPGGAY